MKQIVLLTLVLLLLVDLGEDGQLGKATFVAPQSDAKTSLASPLVDYSGTVDSHYTLPADGWEICPLLQCPQVTLPVQPALRIIIYNHTNSSGGISL
jgi:hypothetical protein